MITVTDFATPQEALDAVTGEGAVVYFPASGGPYDVTKPLLPKSGTTLLGDGYGSLIKCADEGWLQQIPDSAGLIGLNVIEHVSIRGLRLRGTKTADISHTPKLIYIHQSTDISIKDNRLEHTAFEGIWEGGGQALTRRISVCGNQIDDVGFPAAAYIGLPAIQMNGEDSIISENVITNVGVGIGASGARTLVSGNRISGVTSIGIGTGDGGDVYGVTVTGNSIELESGAGVRRGISISGGNGAYGMTTVINNHVRIVGSVDGQKSRGIYKTSAKRVLIQSNIVEIVGRGNGIECSGISGGSLVLLDGNVVLGIDEIATSCGIAAVAGGAGKAIKIISSSNRVLGLTQAQGSFAYDFTDNGGGTLDARMVDDWTDGGAVRCGSNYYGAGQMDDTLIRLET